MAYERRVTDFKGEKTLEEWIDIFKRRAGSCDKFSLDTREKVFYRAGKGFFTYVIDHYNKRICIPKMCGDGKFLRHVIGEFLDTLKPLGITTAYFCSRRKPDVYLRVANGELDHVRLMKNVNTGKEEPMYFYTVKLEDFKKLDKKEYVQKGTICNEKIQYKN